MSVVVEAQNDRRNAQRPQVAMHRNCHILVDQFVYLKQLFNTNELSMNAALCDF